MHHLVVIAAATRSLANPWSIARASSRNLAALLPATSSLRAVSRSPMFRLQRPPHPSGCKTLENMSKARRTRACAVYVVQPRSSCRRATAQTHAAANCENRFFALYSSHPGLWVTKEARLAAARDPCTVRLTKRTNCAPPVGQKQQNINKEALQTVRPRTWRSVRSTPHQ